MEMEELKEEIEAYFGRYNNRGFFVRRGVGTEKEVVLKALGITGINADAKVKGFTDLDSFFSLANSRTIERYSGKLNEYIRSRIRIEQAHEEWITIFKSVFEEEPTNANVIKYLNYDASKASNLMKKGVGANTYERSVIRIKEKKELQDLRTEIPAIKEKHKIENKISRRKALAGLTILSAGGLTLAGFNLQRGTIELDKEKTRYETLKTDYKQYRLWSTVTTKIEPITENEDYEYFKKLIKPLSDLAENWNNGLTNLLKTQRDSVGVSYHNDLSLISFKEELVKKDNKLVVAYKNGTSEYIYDFGKGVYSYIGAKGNDYKEDKYFKGLNTKIYESFIKPIEKESKIGSLESGLERFLKIINDSNSNRNSNSLETPPSSIEDKIAPVLFYVLYFPGFLEKRNESEIYKKAYMYRYPAYLKNDDDEFMKHYEDYNHYDRPWFENFKDKRGYELLEKKEKKVNAWISAIYADYGVKTIEPIRTLVIEYPMNLNGNESLYLFCVDFKFKESHSER